MSKRDRTGGGQRCWSRASRRFLHDALRVVLAVALVGIGPQVQAATLLQWDIPLSASSVAGTTNGSSPTNGSGVSGISGTVITINGSISGGSSSSGWRWYDQTGNTDLSTALSGTNYFSWSVTTNGVTSATINGLGPTSFSRGASGPTSLALLYSTSADFSTYRTLSGSTAIQSASTDISSGLAGDLVSSNIVLNPGSTGYFRLAFWGATTTTSNATWTGTNSVTNDFSLLGTSSNSVAQRSLTWNGAGGAGSTWDSSTSNIVWLDSGTATYFNDGDNATFTAASTVNVAAGGVSAGNVTVSNASGSVVVQGGVLTAGALAKSGAGTLEITGTNSFTSASLTGGSVQIANNSSVGSAALSIDNAQVTTTAAVTTLANAINVGSNGATLAVSGSTLFSGVINTTGAVANQAFLLTKSGTGILAVNKVFGTQMTKNTSGGAFTLNVTDGGMLFTTSAQRNLGGTNVWNGNVSSTGGTFMLHQATLQGTGTFSIDGATTIQSRLNFGKSTVANRLIVNSPLTLNASSSASLELTGIATGSGGITVSAGSGSVRLFGTPTDGVNTLGGALAVNSTTEVYSQSLGNLVPTIAGAQVLRFVNTTTGSFGGVIAGGGSVGIGGSALVALTGFNTYSGGTLLDGDVGITSVWDGTAGSLGSGAITAIGSTGRIFLQSGTSVNFSQSLNTGTSSTFMLGLAGTGVTYLVTGSVTGSGQLRASTGSTIDLTSQTALTNTNTGGIEIGNAYVRAGSDENLGGGPVNFSSTNTSSGFIAAASGTISRNFTIGGSGTASLSGVFNTAGNTLTISSAIADKAATVGGGITKAGAGSLVLTGSNTYTGATTVSAGTLRVDGSIASLSALTVQSGAVLTGNGSIACPLTVDAGGQLAGIGTIAGITSVAGMVAPGNSIGTLTVANDFVWNGASAAGSTTDWFFELGPSNTSDLLSITGGASDFIKDATAGSVFRFDFGGSSEQGTFTLVTWGGVTNFNASDFSYTNLGSGNTATFSVQGNNLTAVVVPEPGSVVLVGLGIAGLVLGWRRRRST